MRPLTDLLHLGCWLLVMGRSSASLFSASLPFAYWAMIWLVIWTLVQLSPVGDPDQEADDLSKMLRPGSTGRAVPYEAQREAQPRRLDPRPHRSGGPAAVQRARHGRRVRNRPDPDADPGGDEGRQSQRPAARKQPKLKPNQAKHLLELHDLGTYTQAELAELFGVGRSTIAVNRSSAALPRWRRMRSTWQRSQVIPRHAT
jgi:hypothetical protein